METLVTALYPIGSEEEDEIHGFVSQMWIDTLDPEIMALPAVGIHKTIKRRLKEGHKAAPRVEQGICPGKSVSESQAYGP